VRAAGRELEARPPDILALTGIAIDICCTHEKSQNSVGIFSIVDCHSRIIMSQGYDM
jgi:hypothetical protein